MTNSKDKATEQLLKPDKFNFLFFCFAGRNGENTFDGTPRSSNCAVFSAVAVVIVAVVESGKLRL